MPCSGKKKKHSEVITKINAQKWKSFDLTHTKLRIGKFMNATARLKTNKGESEKVN
jgi:hypothetical protein